MYRHYNIFIVALVALLIHYATAADMGKTVYSMNELIDEIYFNVYNTFYLAQGVYDCSGTGAAAQIPNDRTVTIEPDALNTGAVTFNCGYNGHAFIINEGSTLTISGAITFAACSPYCIKSTKGYLNIDGARFMNASCGSNAIGQAILFNEGQQDPANRVSIWNIANAYFETVDDFQTIGSHCRVMSCRGCHSVNLINVTAVNFNSKQSIQDSYDDSIVAMMTFITTYNININGLTLTHVRTTTSTDSPKREVSLACWSDWGTITLDGATFSNSSQVRLQAAAATTSVTVVRNVVFNHGVQFYGPTDWSYGALLYISQFVNASKSIVIDSVTMNMNAKYYYAMYIVADYNHVNLQNIALTANQVPTGTGMLVFINQCNKDLFIDGFSLTTTVASGTIADVVKYTYRANYGPSKFTVRGVTVNGNAAITRFMAAESIHGVIDISGIILRNTGTMFNFLQLSPYTASYASTISTVDVLAKIENFVNFTASTGAVTIRDVKLQSTLTSFTTQIWIECEPCGNLDVNGLVTVTGNIPIYYSSRMDMVSATVNIRNSSIGGTKGFYIKMPYNGVFTARTTSVTMTTTTTYAFEVIGSNSFLMEDVTSIKGCGLVGLTALTGITGLPSPVIRRVSAYNYTYASSKQSRAIYMNFDTYTAGGVVVTIEDSVLSCIDSGITQVEVTRYSNLNVNNFNITGGSRGIKTQSTTLFGSIKITNMNTNRMINGSLDLGVGREAALELTDCSFDGSDGGTTPVVMISNANNVTVARIKINGGYTGISYVGANMNPKAMTMNFNDITMTNLQSMSNAPFFGISFNVIPPSVGVTITNIYIESTGNHSSAGFSISGITSLSMNNLTVVRGRLGLIFFQNQIDSTLTLTNINGTSLYSSGIYAGLNYGTAVVDNIMMTYATGSLASTSTAIQMTGLKDLTMTYISIDGCDTGIDLTSVSGARMLNVSYVDLANMIGSTTASKTVSVVGSIQNTYIQFSDMSITALPNSNATHMYLSTMAYGVFERITTTYGYRIAAINTVNSQLRLEHSTFSYYKDIGVSATSGNQLSLTNLTLIGGSPNARAFKFQGFLSAVGYTLTLTGEYSGIYTAINTSTVFITQSQIVNLTANNVSAIEGSNPLGCVYELSATTISAESAGTTALMSLTDARTIKFSNLIVSNFAKLLYARTNVNASVLNTHTLNMTASSTVVDRMIDIGGTYSSNFVMNDTFVFGSRASELIYMENAGDVTFTDAIILDSDGHIFYYSNTNGTGNIRFEHIQYGACIGGGVTIWRASDPNNSKFVISDVYSHGSTDLDYVARILIDGSGSFDNGTGIFDVLADDAVAAGNMSLITLGGSGIPVLPIQANNITLRNIDCTGCIHDAVTVRMPYLISNILVQVVKARNLLFIDLAGAHTVASSMSSVKIYNSTAVNNAFRAVLMGLPEFYSITASDTNVFCNHIDSATTTAGYYYSDSNITMPINRFGGNIMSGSSNGRHLFATHKIGDLPAGNLGNYAVDDMYVVYLSSVVSPVERFYVIPYEGGAAIKLLGENIVEYGAEFLADFTTFRGARIRNIKVAYMSDITFIPGNSDESDGSNEIILTDERGRKGLFCTDGTYAPPPASIVLNSTDFSFTGVSPGLGHDGIPTLANLTGYIAPKYFPFVSVRCTLIHKDDGSVAYGDWYTPEDGNDLKCRIRSDHAHQGVHHVQIEVLGNLKLSINTLSGAFSVDPTPTVVAVSSRYIVNNSPIQIHGLNFTDKGMAICRFKRTYIHDASESTEYIVPAAFVNLQRYDCTVPDLSPLSATVGMYVDVALSFYGGSWFKLPRNALKPDNVIYDNYDFNEEERPFIYMGSFVPQEFPQTAPPVQIWTFGHHEFTYTSNAVNESGMVYVSDIEEMYCFFYSADGNVTIVKPTTYARMNETSSESTLVCRVPPSPKLALQVTRVSIGYWLDFSYKIDASFNYTTFNLTGVKFAFVAAGGYVYFTGEMDPNGLAGYECGPNNELCYCNFRYYDATNTLRIVNNKTVTRYPSLATYRCEMPTEIDSTVSPNATVSIWFNGEEIGTGLHMLVKFSQPVGASSMNTYNGDIGRVIPVTGSLFVVDALMLCGFARVKEGEWPASYDGRRVECGNPNITYGLSISYATVINSTYLECHFDDFLMSRLDSIHGEWVGSNPDTPSEYLCLGAYYTVYITNSLDDLYGVNSTYGAFQYMPEPKAAVIEPPTANHWVQEYVTIGGTHVAAIGNPSCWWAELVSNTSMPTSHSAAVNRSVVYPGTFIQQSLGNLVRCQLPKWNGVLHVGVVLSNGDQLFNSSNFAYFRYKNGVKLSIVTPPDSFTKSSVELERQPVIQVTNLEDNVINDVEVIVTATATNVTGNKVIQLYLNSRTMDNTTGIVAYSGFRVDGPQYAVYDMCFQAKAIDRQSDPLCHCCTAVAPCENIIPNSVEHELGCVCKRGYQGSTTCEICPENRYRSDITTEQCVNCPEHMISIPGSIDIRNCTCKPGFVNVPVEGSDVGICLCPAGYAYVLSSDECYACPQGYYKEEISNGECTKCSTEFDTGPAASNSSNLCRCMDAFQRVDPSNNKSPCVCQAGNYYNATSRTCLPCRMGYYKHVANMSEECWPCKWEHETTRFQGTISITDCICKPSFVRRNGTVQSTEAVCDVGYYHDQTFKVCSACSMHTYKNFRGLENCTSCDPSTKTLTTGATSISLCFCREGYWLPLNEFGKVFKCNPCPDGAECPGIDAQPRARKNYYKVGAEGQNFLKCPATDACEGNNKCNTGYRGEMCALCDVNYYKEGVQCRKCGGWLQSLAMTVYIGLWLGAIFMLMMWSYRPKPRDKTAPIIVLVNFVQTLSLFLNTNFSWPPEIYRWMSFTSIVSLDISFTTVECSNQFGNFDSLDVMMLKFALPAAALFTIFTYYFLHWIWNALVLTCLPLKLLVSHKYVFASAVRATTTFLMFFYIPLCQTVLAFFDCVEAEDGTMRLQRLRSQQCYEGRHKEYLQLAILAVIFYVIGIPAFIMYLLSNKVGSNYGDKQVLYLGNMFVKYLKEYYAWEIVIMLRKLLTVGSFVLLTSRPSMQSLCIVFTCYMSSTLTNRYRPFVISTLSICDIIGQAVIMLLVVVGLGDLQGVDAFIGTFMVLTGAGITILLGLYALSTVVTVRTKKYNPEDVFNEDGVIDAKKTKPTIEKDMLTVDKTFDDDFDVKDTSSTTASKGADISAASKDDIELLLIDNLNANKEAKPVKEKNLDSTFGLEDDLGSSIELPDSKLGPNAEKKDDPFIFDDLDEPAPPKDAPKNALTTTDDIDLDDESHGSNQDETLGSTDGLLSDAKTESKPLTTKTVADKVETKPKPEDTFVDSKVDVKPLEAEKPDEIDDDDESFLF